MQHADWDDFASEMAQLCEAYDRKKTPELLDAYWTALARMQLGTFRSAALFAREKSGLDGFEKFPKPGRFWSLRDEALRAQRAVEAAPAQASLLAIDDFTAFANRRMLAYLNHHGAASGESLPAMIAEKNRLAAAYREIDREETVGEQEYADALRQAWDRVFVAAGAKEAA